MSVATKHFDSQDLNALLCQPRVLADLIEAYLSQKNPQVLADIVLQDAPLAARLLSAARKNNVALNGDEPVSSAIHALGSQGLTSLALVAAQQLCQRNFSDAELTFQYRLWSVSQIGGIFARCLAPSVNFSRIEEAQLCGILLNLGIHLLFHKFGQDYLDLDVQAASCPAQVAAEQQHFGQDHLCLADQLISSWKLDSFLADAVRFLPADKDHIAHSSLLLKIARLTQHFCLSPEQLTDQGQQLAEQLLGLKPSESHYLFHWGQDLYPPVSGKLDQFAAVREEFKTSIGRLQRLSFLLAGQEAARARIAKATGRDNLLLLSRQLLLEQSPAHEVFFFLLDNKRNLLTGVMVAGQHRLVHDVDIPLQSHYSLAADAYLENRSVSSFTVGKELTVTDNLLLRLCEGSGFFCCPLTTEDQLCGVVVLRLESEQELEACHSEQLQGLIRIISAAIVAEPETVLTANSDASGLLFAVSQEVKNPLTIINNYVEVIGRTEKNAENRSLAAAIKGEVRRIDTIFSDYLSRQEDTEFFDQGVDLNQLVREVTDSMLGSLADPVTVSFEVSLQEGLNRFQANSALIRQILTQLLKNARESFVADGVVKVSTRLVFVASRQWQVELVVQDNGPGLPVQVKKNLFKPVYSSKGSGHAGVGLSQVKSMVAKLNGQIGCYSSAKNGTCFTIQIPYGEHESEN